MFDDRFRCRILLVLVLLAGGCGDRERIERFVREDSAGVVIARNISAATDTVELAKHSLRLGVVDGAREYVFEWISYVLPLRDGRILVVDNRGSRVAIFDEHGTWLKDVGRRGDGPGEYRAPISAVEQGDTVVVWDTVNRRVLYFTSEGDALHTAERVHDPRFRLGAGWVVARERGQRFEPPPAEGFLVRVAANGAVIDTVVGPYPIPRMELEQSGDGMLRAVNPPTFSAWPSWTVHGERIYWSSGLEPRVEVRDETAELIRIVELPRVARSVTERDKRDWIGRMELLVGELSPDDRDQWLRDTRFSERLPVISGLLVDDQGLLWVADYDPGVFGSDPAHVWDVVDRDGRIVRRTSFPRGFRLLAVRDGRAYGVSLAEAGVQVVDVFPIP
jgi:hypothetical protein